MRSLLPVLLATLLIHPAFAVAETEAAASADSAVSFYRDVRPILQAQCQGCHQPAKRGGDYLLTSYEHLLRPGESGEPSIVPGKPEESSLLEQITPVDGEAAMPKNAKPLAAEEIALIRRWIEQGAIDDTPENARVRYDRDHPPVYTRPPIITSLAYSPDGQLLAIAGFHEVLLRSADGQQLVARLIGLSERIESVAFSPDGSRLAVAGGLPGRGGELQIWNVASHELELSVPLTFDTIYGASWSPDGKLVAVGCGDATVRAFDSQSGEQVFFNGVHDDWALATIFSKDGSLLVSVGRDMSTKLYNVPTQRFVDNVTSVTPGALKGGLTSLDRHPERDEILVGGADGVPRIYRMERVTNRVIGDDANLIRRFPEMRGRIYGVAYAPDGKTMACVSSLDGRGQLFTFFCDVSSQLPDDIKVIVQKVVTNQTAEEKQRLEVFVTSDVKTLTQSEFETGVYALDWRPDGKMLAIAGADGMVRLVDPADGNVTSEFLPVDVSAEGNVVSERQIASSAVADDHEGGEQPVPPGRSVVALEIEPAVIELNSRLSETQVLVTGVLDTGDRVDLTRVAQLQLAGDCALLSPAGRVSPVQSGTSELSVSYGDQQQQIPVHVSGVEDEQEISFIRDVNPVLSRLGCNQGTCHGAKDGRNGFKLSLRGYDPIFDVRSFTDDLKSRRTNLASPDDSLMLLKASGAVPHVGGQLTRPGEAYYEIIRAWIAQGAHLDTDVERVVSIEIQPHNPIVQNLGARQQLRVTATYSNGQQRDVTGEAFLESGNTEVAEANRAGVVTAIRRGEAPILVRFEGSYAATTLTVMGDRAGFVWEQPETWGRIDELVAEKWQRMKILPSGLCSDEDFLRRVSLDLTGLPPTAEQVLAFLEDSRESRVKREELVDRLIGSEAFVEYWTNKWADLLQVNSKYLGTEGAALFRGWIRSQIQENTPYDEFARSILTASGSNKENPAASYYKILREPDLIMENTTHLFLAIRFNCNKCHDHPFERWTQDQYYETASYFAQVGLKRDPANEKGDIGGSAVEDKKPLWEEIFDKEDGEMKHDRTGDIVAPLVPYNRELVTAETSERRSQLASWITSPDNEYFGRSYANRIWGYLLGVGMIEPLDDIRAGNPPSNPELLDYLTETFVASGFDVRELMRSICKSRVYQLEVGTNDWNVDDRINFSHALPKRLPAEVLYDAVYTVTGSRMEIPGVPPGTRAAELPDVAINLADGFLENLGRPVRESACECERSSELQLGPVMALMNGATVSTAISQDENAIEVLVREETDNEKLIDEIFLRVLNRHARPHEVEATLAIMGQLHEEHQLLLTELQAYEARIAPILAEREAFRQATIEQAEQELAAYEKELAPRREAEEQARQERIQVAKAELEEALQSQNERFQDWLQNGLKSQTNWQFPEIGRLRAASGVRLRKQEDSSILASGKNDLALDYNVDLSTFQDGITAVRLEVLADESLPKNGPGRAPDGNFVLSEIELQARTEIGGRANPKFVTARADHSQKNYPVERAIDGDVTSRNGWAISPEQGKDHVAIFELDAPIQLGGADVKKTLRFRLRQHFLTNKHSIGKFRISVTSDPLPASFGLPQQIQEFLEIAADQRTEEQLAKLREYFEENDELALSKKGNLVAAETPLPVDPRQVELKANLEETQKPLPLDPHLVRYRRAVELSEQQLKHDRLTIAQDLTWALINSPAFLFNH